MVNPHHVVIETYVVLSIINAFLGLGTEIYQESEPTESLRSPFNSFPLGSNFTQLDADGTTDSLTNPANSTGDPIPWVTNAAADFTATIDVILEFTKFFTAGFVIQLLTTMGFPGEWLLIVTVPLAIYVMYMTFVMITNRLGN